MAARKTAAAAPRAKAEVEDRSDEAWIRSASGDTSVRVRSLTYYLTRGGKILDARLHEAEDGAWSMWLRLADRPGELRLNQFHEDVAKTWVDVNVAIAVLRDDFGYFGGVYLSTDRKPSAPKSRPSVEP